MSDTLTRQEIRTFCIRKGHGGNFDYSAMLRPLLDNIFKEGFRIVQVSTTSFVEDGLPSIAYTLLLEK